MGRDYAALLTDTPCWSQRTQHIYDQTGVPLHDVALQAREELVALCEFIAAHDVRSYLEIGVWTGRVVTALHELFDFDLVAACDLGLPERLGLPLRLPFGTRFFRGDSHGDAFVQWRAELGHVDLVFIDGDHSYDGVRRDWEINRRFPHRFLAFHDITGVDRTCRGVKRLWEELPGDKVEILRPNRALSLPFSTMGIGIIAA
ncbi:MAG: hypothetical protein CSA66_05325 [Proteobacteria bacterium]|nr:MAG: hypothetical protein CSA66_05325 [Pseudomonadota bacterium]